MRGLIDKIRLIPDEAMEDRNKGIRGTRVEVELNSGEVLKETVLVPKGDPENPLTREDIIDKLHTCARGLAESETLSGLVEAIIQIRGGKPFRNPMAIL